MSSSPIEELILSLVLLACLWHLKLGGYMDITLSLLKCTEENAKGALTAGVNIGQESGTNVTDFQNLI